MTPEGNQSIPHMPEKEQAEKEFRELNARAGYNDTAQVFLLGPWSHGWNSCERVMSAKLLASEEKVKELQNEVESWKNTHRLDMAEKSFLENRLAIAEERARDAIKTVNAVQNQLRSYTTNSSPFLAGAKEAWNINARFLSQNGELQNEYLESVKVVVESEKGAE